MNNLMFGNLIRITRPTAKKLYEKGKTIILCPVNLRPDSPYGVSVCIDGKDNFDKKTDAFVIHNCVDAETGRYPAFYTEYTEVE